MRGRDPTPRKPAARPTRLSALAESSHVRPAGPRILAQHAHLSAAAAPVPHEPHQPKQRLSRLRSPCRFIPPLLMRHAAMGPAAAAAAPSLAASELVGLAQPPPPSDLRTTQSMRAWTVAYCGMTSHLPSISTGGGRPARCPRRKSRPAKAQAGGMPPAAAFPDLIDTEARRTASEITPRAGHRGLAARGGINDPQCPCPAAQA